MSPDERLKVIEKCVEIDSVGGFDKDDTRWLVNRVKKLTKELEKIRHWKSDARVCCFPSTFEILDEE